MSNWIDDSVIIDFNVPEDIRNMMMECEKMNEEENCGYFNYAESLGYMCKEACVRGHMTKKQWEIIEKKYESL